MSFAPRQTELSPEEKTENAAQFQQYLDATSELRKELGILIKEEMCKSLAAAEILAAS